MAFTYEQQYLPLVTRYGQAYNVPIALILAHMKQESNFNYLANRNEPAINDKSYGLMQVLLGTAKSIEPNVTAAKLYEPETNIRIAVKYIKSNLNRYKNDIKHSIAAYNAGYVWQNAQGQYTNSKGRTNVNDYVNSVHAYYLQYIKQYGSDIDKGINTQLVILTALLGVGAAAYYSLRKYYGY